MWIETEDGELINTAIVERLRVEPKRGAWCVTAILNGSKPVVVANSIGTREDAIIKMKTKALLAQNGKL